MEPQPVAACRSHASTGKIRSRSRPKCSGAFDCQCHTNLCRARSRPGSSRREGSWIEPCRVAGSSRRDRSVDCGSHLPRQSIGRPGHNRCKMNEFDLWRESFLSLRRRFESVCNDCDGVRISYARETLSACPVDTAVRNDLRTVIGNAANAVRRTLTAITPSKISYTAWFWHEGMDRRERCYRSLHVGNRHIKRLNSTASSALAGATRSGRPRLPTLALAARRAPRNGRGNISRADGSQHGIPARRPSLMS